jgi:transposase
MEPYTVGLDVHSRESVFVVQDATGVVTGEGKIPTTEPGFREWQAAHALPPGTRVFLETGTVSFYVAHVLAQLGLVPIVVDAHEVRRRAQRPTQKSDRGDAFELCDGGRRGLYRAVVHIPAPATHALRQALARRRHFVQAASREILAARHVLRAAGRAAHAGCLNSRPAWERLLARVAAQPAARAPLERHYALWQAADAQVTALDAELRALPRALEPPVTRLQTIPGVGPIVARTIVAALADVSRFPSAKHVGSYAGLVPTTHQSGRVDHHGHITKRGSRELRAMLCEAAQHAARPTHPLNAFYAPLCVRHGRKRALIAVAHRLARIAFAMLRDGRDFDPTRLGLEAGAFTTTTTRRYRRRRRAA